MWTRDIAARLFFAAEDGGHLIELAIAMAVMSVAVMGVIGSMGSGMALVGSARQRSAGSAVATERLERVHNMPYESVALYEQPSHVDDPGHPDGNVTSDNTYEVDANTTEPLVVDTTSGGLKHVDDPWTLGQTEFSVYQYVTWVDDPAVPGTQDYKRVVVVVTWKYPVQSRVVNTVTHSSFVSDGTIAVVASPTPSPTPTPTNEPLPTAGPDDLLGVGELLFPPDQAPPNPTGPCPSDTTGPTPSFQILSGAGAEQGYMSSTTVQVHLQATDECPPIEARLSNDNASYTSAATMASDEPTTVAWTIAAGDGRKRIYARFRDAQGNPSGTYGADVILDQTTPTPPSDLRTVVCNILSDDRTVTMTWNASTDANLSGYRIYRSIGTEPFEILATTGALSVNDTTKKSAGIRYLVRAYDKAGNESESSAVLSFAKNAC